MMRFLLLLLLMILFIMILRKLRFVPKKRDNINKLVHCVNCKTYISESQAIKRYISNNTVYFCSKECEKKYKGEKR